MQSTRKCMFASMFNAAHTQCRLAISLLCSPHACAGLRPPCLAAYTRVQVCNPLVMQPTRKCGFALTSPCRPHAGAGYNQTVLQPTCNAGLHLCYLHEKSCCHAQTPPDKHTTSLSRSPHAGAGLRPHCHAAHTHARVCTAKSCAAHTRARVCICASTLSCSPHTRAGLHSHVVCNPHACAGLHPRCPLILQPTSKLVATTLLTLPIALGLAILKRSRASVLFAPTAAAQAHSTCHAASLTPVRPRAVTAMLRELAAPPRRSLPHST